LVTGFIDHLQIITTIITFSLIHVLVFSLQHIFTSQFVLTSHFLVTNPKNVLCLCPYWLATVSQLTKLKVKIKVMLQLAVSKPVYLGVKHASGVQDQIFVL
jgi:hypothetical protein